MIVILRKTLTPRVSLLGSSFSFPAYSLLSTSSIEASPSLASPFAVQYLIQSCGLPHDKAARAARYVPHLKSSDKPDSVLSFLRHAGVSASHIEAAASRDPRFLCCSVEKILEPRMAQLRDIGFSPAHTSLFLSLCPEVFWHTDLRQKVLFWLKIFSSVEELLGALKVSNFLRFNLNSASANLSFLKEQCGLSATQLVNSIKRAPKLITSKPETLKNKAEMAKELGIRCPSGMFVHALISVISLNQHNMDARLNNLRKLGFSQEQVACIVSRSPYVLCKSEERMAHRMEFLTKEAGCDKLELATNPNLFAFSMEKRLIPRNLVRKILKLKGHPVANNRTCSFMNPTEKLFLDKYVLPYEPSIPGLCRAYQGASAGSTEGFKWFEDNLR